MITFSVVALKSTVAIIVVTKDSERNTVNEMSVGPSIRFVKFKISRQKRTVYISQNCILLKCFHLRGGRIIWGRIF